MTIYMEVSRLHRVVTMVARGKVSADDIRGATQQLVEAHVPEFAKIVDVSAATSALTEEQVQRVADLLHGDPNEKRGPVAFVVNPDRIGFAHAFEKATRGERPISLFRSLHEARFWLAEIQRVREGVLPAAQRAGDEASAWNDRERQGILIRGQRRRRFTVASRTFA